MSMIQPLGYAAQLKRFNTLLQRDAWPQAIIFVGPRHIGKQTIADFVIQQLIPGENKNHPDIRWITPLAEENQISLDAIKQGVEHIYHSPLTANKKILGIAAAELLSTEAANALLKPIEDFHSHRHIFLLTNDIQRMLPTIRSRAVVVHFPLLSNTDIQTILETTGVSSTEAAIRAQASAGRLGLALSDHQPTHIEQQLTQLTQAILERSANRFTLVEQIHKSLTDLPPIEIKDLLTEQTSKWQNIFLVEHRRSTQVLKKQQLRRLSRFCETIPRSLQQHVSVRSLLDVLITQL